MSYFVFTVVFLAAAPSPDAGVEQAGPQARQMYYQAQEKTRAGNPAEADAILKRIVDEHPGDAYADDALLERARLAEEALGQPARALELYRELIGRYPDSRRVRRARARVDFLEKHLDKGEDVLVEYMVIRRQSPHRPAEESVDLMLKLLEENPDFSLQPDGLYWVADMMSRQGRFEEAKNIFDRLAKSHPDHRLAVQALVDLGALYLRHGDADAAELVYARLAGLGGPRATRAAEEAQGLLHRLRWKKRISLAAGLIWLITALGLWLFLLISAGRGSLTGLRLSRPPLEAVLFLVIMAGLVLWAWSGTRQTTHALLYMGGMVLLVLLPNGWLLRSIRLRAVGMMAWTVWLTLVCLAAVVMAIHLAGMEEQVLHTIEFGPGG